MSDWAWKFRAVLMISIALPLALLYDSCRTLPGPLPPNTNSIPEVWILNPIDLLYPGETALGNLEQSDPIESSELFKAFTINAEKAHAKYSGKTFLIKGKVLETFEANVGGVEVNWAWPLTRATENITLGIMLSPDDAYVDEELRKRISAYSDLHSDDVRRDYVLPPFTVSSKMNVDGYEKLYAKYLQAGRSDFDWMKPYRRLFSRYSDDVSFLSKFGGVYCMFKTAYRANRYRAEKKKSMVAQCKIREFMPGRLEEVSEYKRSFTVDTKVQTKPRVLAVGCVEITYETTSRY